MVRKPSQSIAGVDAVAANGSASSGEVTTGLLLARFDRAIPVRTLAQSTGGSGRSCIAFDRLTVTVTSCVLVQIIQLGEQVLVPFVAETRRTCSVHKEYMDDPTPLVLQVGTCAWFVLCVVFYSLTLLVGIHGSSELPRCPRQGSVAARITRLCVIVHASVCRSAKCGDSPGDRRGGVITNVVFADYGTPTGTCVNETTPSPTGFSPEANCSCLTSTRTAVEKACLNQPSCNVSVDNSNCPNDKDPCDNVHKHIAVLVQCSQPPPPPPAGDVESYYFVDFGREFQGGIRLNFDNGVEGTTVRARPCLPCRRLLYFLVGFGCLWR